MLFLIKDGYIIAFLYHLDGYSHSCRTSALLLQPYSFWAFYKFHSVKDKKKSDIIFLYHTKINRIVLSVHYDFVVAKLLSTIQINGLFSKENLTASIIFPSLKSAITPRY